MSDEGAGVGREADALPPPRVTRAEQRGAADVIERLAAMAARGTISASAGTVGRLRAAAIALRAAAGPGRKAPGQATRRGKGQG